MSGETVIEEWQPGRLLRLRSVPSEDSPGMSPPSDTPLIQEYTLESRAGKTVLRLVHSVIPPTADWDGYYDGTNRGWDMFFINLRHYLENHPGKPRDNVLVMRELSLGLEEFWQRFLGPEGLANDSLASLKSGDSYEAETSMGDKLAGKVIMHLSKGTLVLSVKNMDKALLNASVEDFGGKTLFYLTFATYGGDAATTEAISTRWNAWADRFFSTL